MIPKLWSNILQTDEAKVEHFGSCVALLENSGGKSWRSQAALLLHDLD